jgi:hypothetical protein
MYFPLRRRSDDNTSLMLNHVPDVEGLLENGQLHNIVS